MRKSKQLSALACAATVVLGMNTAAQAALLVYEPFNYSVGAIAGQMNTTSALPETWSDAGTVGSTVHSVVSPGLTAPSGLPSAQGNLADLALADKTELVRLNIPGSLTGTTPTYGANSTLYYSLLLNVPSTNGLTIGTTNANANNDIVIGLNNAQGSQPTQPTTWGGELVIRLGVGGSGTYDLGIRGSTTATGTTHFTPDLTAGTTYFVVVSASINSTDTDGTNTIWVNPDSSTYGQATPPAAGSGLYLDNGSSGGTGAASSYSYQSLIMGAGKNTAGSNPNDLDLDEIRMGDTWTDVTSQTALAVIPEPAGLSLLGLGALGMLRRRRR